MTSFSQTSLIKLNHGVYNIDTYTDHAFINVSLNTCNQKDIEQTTIHVITVECGLIKHIKNNTYMQQHV